MAREIVKHKEVSEDDLRVENTVRILNVQGGITNYQKKIIREATIPVDSPAYDEYVENFRILLDGIDCDMEEMEEFIFPLMYRWQKNKLEEVRFRRRESVFYSLGLLSYIGVSAFGFVAGILLATINPVIGILGGLAIPALYTRGHLSSTKKLRAKIADEIDAEVEDDHLFPELHGHLPESLHAVGSAIRWHKRENLPTFGKTYAELLEGHKSPQVALAKSSGNSKALTSRVDIKPQLEVFDDLVGQWKSWEMDVLRVVQYPGLFDLSVKETRRFHEAITSSKQLRPKNLTSLPSDHPFIKSVVELEIAWKMAVEKAKRLKLRNFPVNEQKRLSDALKLLKIALDDSGNPSERQVSYKRAMKELDGLVTVPEAALGEIEKAGIRLELV